MTKAAQKRQKELRERLVTLVGQKLKSFHNLYINAYTNWNIGQIEKVANLVPEDKEAYFKQVVGKSRKEMMIPNSSYSRKGQRFVGEVTRNDAYSKWHKSEIARRRLDFDALLRLEFMNEADEGYQVKFNRLIDKMIREEFSPYKVTVESVRNNGPELEILISSPDSDKEFHARAIWVEGSIKAPHYRFITTTRKKK